MTTMMTDPRMEAAARLLRAYHGGAFCGRHNQQVRALAAVLAEHPGAWLEGCSDERTGVRYGMARVRLGRAVKIGYTTGRFQLWAVW